MIKEAIQKIRESQFSKNTKSLDIKNNYLSDNRTGDIFFRVNSKNWVKLSEPKSQSEDTILNQEFGKTLENIRQRKIAQQVKK